MKQLTIQSLLLQLVLINWRIFNNWNPILVRFVPNDVSFWMTTPRLFMFQFVWKFLLAALFYLFILIAPQYPIYATIPFQHSS